MQSPSIFSYSEPQKYIVVGTNLGNLCSPVLFVESGQEFNATISLRISILKSTRAQNNTFY